MSVERWRDPIWLASAYAWVEEQALELGLVRTGDIEQPHVYPWSTVLRVPTATRQVWFKANDDFAKHEAGLVTLLSSRVPARVPPLLAKDVDRGWMLMADAGRSLREVAAEEQNLDRWHDVLAGSAEVQLSVQDEVADLLALGVPDRRLPTLADGYAALMDEIDAEPRFRHAHAQVVELVGALAEFGIAETIQHDDLHGGQVFVKDDRQLILDWGDACVSHPFFTLSVSLEGEIAWGLEDEADSVDTAPFRDSYLAAYSERYNGDLVEAARVAVRLGWACRAVNGHVPGDDDHTMARLRMFVDGRP